ncbi:MAG: hypothetical protein OHK0040_02800 [bacterium]
MFIAKLAFSAIFSLILLIPSRSEALDLFNFLKNPDKKVTKDGQVVSKVIDGDTIILENGEKVRYLGIDAPETHRKEDGKWVNVYEPFGEEATLFNRGLVEGKTVSLSFDREKRDSHGRILAYVYVKGVMVNTKILSEGLAFPYDIGRLKNYNVFKLAFLNAIKSRRGLYKTSFLNTKLNEQLGLYGWYRGRINSVYYSNEKVVIKTDYLDIHLAKKGKTKITGLKAGSICYFYGKLTRKKERYILLSENPHHIVVE